MLYKDELYHHGILGQHWGKRNGPPYPLKSSVSDKIQEKGKARKDAEYKKKRDKLNKTGKGRTVGNSEGYSDAYLRRMERLRKLGEEYDAQEERNVRSEGSDKWRSMFSQDQLDKMDQRRARIQARLDAYEDTDDFPKPSSWNSQVKTSGDISKPLFAMNVNDVKGIYSNSNNEYMRLMAKYL